MTVAELIEKLRAYDPSDVICVNDQEITPASDELSTEFFDDYNCVVISASTW